MGQRASRIIVGLLIVVLFLATGCDLGMLEANTGSLAIRLGDSSRSLVWEPELDMDIASYTIKGTGPTANDSFEVSGHTEGLFTKDGLAVGSWTITVDGYNADSEKIATVHATATVTRNATTPVTVVLRPLEGMGYLSIDMSWTDSQGVLVNPMASMVIRDEQGNDIQDISDPVALNISGQTANVTVIDLPSGWYEVMVKLSDGASTVWQGVFVLRVVENTTTWGIVVIPEDQIQIGPGAGTVAITIQEDMDDPLGVGFSGMPDSVEAGTEITLTSTGTYSGTEQYRWYINGVRQADQTASSFSYTFDTAGTQTVSLLVLDGGALGGYGRSIVIEGGVAQPTVLSISVKTPPTKIEYVLGEDLDLSNLMLTASYTDTTESNVSWGLEGLTAEPTHGTPLTEAGTKVVTVFYGGKSSTFTVNVGPSYTGIGTLADPYIAYTAVGLDTIRRVIIGEDGGSNQLNAVIHLGADIDLNEIDSIGDNWIPLGNTTLPFRGTFDGNGHTISNLRINRPTGDYVGFFGAQSGVISGVIRDVQLVNVQVCGKSNVGSLVGFSSGAIDNCHSAGTVSGNYQYVGGLIGCVIGSVDNCSFTGSVSGLGNWIGGLVGASTGSISHSRASGSVEGTSSTGGLVGRTGGTSGSINYCHSQMNVHGLWAVGGLVGHAYGGSWIEYCYATGSVNGNEDYIGGLVGHLESSSLINSSYALGSVTGRGYVGGIVGRANGNVSNCYATGDVSGLADLIGGIAGYIESSLISDSFAANKVLVHDSSSSNSHFHRLTGHNQFGGLNNNYANSEMILPSGIVANASHNGVDGEDATLSQFKSSDYFSDTATWSDAATWNDAQIWVLSDGDFPHLAWE